MRRLLVLVILAAGLGLGSPPSLAGACSCVTSSVVQNAERADVVFEGVWVSSEEEFPEDDLDDAVDRLFHTFAVERVFRGEAAETVEVVSWADEGSCGTSFREGRYVIFATVQEHSGDLETGSCAGNLLLEDGDRPPSELGEGRVVAGAAGPEGGDGARAREEGTDPVVAAPEAAAAPAGTTGDDGFEVGDLLAALGAVGLGLVVVAAAVAWTVARRRRPA